MMAWKRFGSTAPSHQDEKFEYSVSDVFFLNLVIFVDLFCGRDFSFHLFGAPFLWGVAWGRLSGWWLRWLA